MPDTKVTIAHDEGVLVIEHAENWSAPGGTDQHGAVRIQVFGRSGLCEIMLTPSELAQIVTLVETATAYAAAEKLRRSTQGVVYGPSLTGGSNG